MIAEVVINRSAKRLNRTFDYNIPSNLEELVMIGSTVLVPFGKASTLEEGYVVGIKENTQYEKDSLIGNKFKRILKFVFSPYIRSRINHKKSKKRNDNNTYE